MQEFRIWLNIFLAENGVTTPIEKTIVSILILVCIFVFLCVVYKWLFIWHPLKKKVDKYFKKKKKLKFSCQDHKPDGFVVNVYFLKNKAG